MCEGKFLVEKTPDALYNVLYQFPMEEKEMDYMKTIALVMIVKDEERCLRRCLDSVRGLVDQMIVVDTGSRDRTPEIALEEGAQVFTYVWKEDFADARNYALSFSHADWNLVLDADEYVVSGTREGIEPFLELSSRLGDISRRDAYMEKGELSYSQTRLTRLLPKGVRFKGRIHEQPDSSFSSFLLPIQVEHDGYMQTGKKEKRNLPYLLRELKDKPKDSYLLYKAAGSYQTLGDEDRALVFFRKFYREVPLGVSYRGKGVVGYLYSLMACQKFGEVLEIIRQEEGRLGNYASFHFFCGIFYMKLIKSDTARYLNYLPRIEQAYLRCLEIGADIKDEEDVGVGSYKAAYNLGAWYEVSGDMGKAKEYYCQAAEQGYQKAQDRLEYLETVGK